MHKERFSVAPKKGEIFVKVYNSLTKELLDTFHVVNEVTLDASIHAARLFADPTEPNYGAYMLAMGTGATGAILSPDKADEKQRKLNTEISRKAFSTIQFRLSTGAAVAYPTKILDLTAEFGSADAVGALNEMGIISPISSNPAVTNPNPEAYPTYTEALDISPYDVLLNYLTFGVKTKNVGEDWVVTWRLTF
jgi:hypothetical protein